jgi:hypothetical protein
LKREVWNNYRRPAPPSGRADRVLPFGSEIQFTKWEDVNCAVCSREKCTLNMDLLAAMLGDGTVSTATAERLGVPHTFTDWTCREFLPEGPAGGDP